MMQPSFGRCPSSFGAASTSPSGPLPERGNAPIIRPNDDSGTGEADLMAMTHRPTPRNGL